MTNTITLNDGREIPQLGFGVFQIPTDETQRAVETALEAGYRHIDTASAYRNEAGVGAALRASGLRREDVYVTTKLKNGDREDPRAAIEASLAALGLDHVDLYLIHWPVPADGLATKIWADLEAFQREGLATSIGVSNFMPEDLDALAKVATVTPAVNQIEVHPTFANNEMASASLRHGMAVEAYSPLGQGKDLEAEAVVTAAQSLGVTTGQVIIRWHLQHGRIVIPKSANPERIKSNLDVESFTLSPEQMAAIDALDTGERIGRDPRTFDWPQTGALPKDWKPGMRP